MPNTAIMPMPRQQFFTANGQVLAGGKLFTYVAGTTTAQATYQDANGTAANTNPVILDAGGFANIWLAASTYKIVAQDANGVQQWTQDNVSAVSLAELQSGGSSVSSLNVSGAATIGGGLTVGGTITGAGQTLSGTLAVAGNFTAGSMAIATNASVGGALAAGSINAGATALSSTLSVAGEADLNGVVKIGGVTLANYITALIPALTQLPGNLIVPGVTTSGGWVIFQFGQGAGTIVKIAIGFGQGGNGYTITPPAGFNSAQMIAGAAFATTSATPGNGLDNISTTITGATINVTVSDGEGHSFTATASWYAVAWIYGAS